MSGGGDQAGAVLRLGLDVSAVPIEPVGAGRYTIELAKALMSRSDIALALVARAADGGRWDALVRAAGDRHRVVAVAPSNRPGRLLFEELGLVPALSRRAVDVDLIHAPHYNAPRFSPVPLVVTVHDLTLVEHPEWHERTKAIFFSRALRLAAARADVVVCPSQFTAARFVNRYAPRGEIKVVAHGIDHRRFSPTEPVVGRDRAVLARLQLNFPYLLHLGTVEPRKNLVVLLEAFDHIAAAHPDLHFVLAGRLAWGAEALQRAIAQSRHAGRVTCLGYVSDDDVPALLRGAKAVAYPSREEGFGLPALEALACGAPLVTTKNTVMAEVADGWALLVSPDDVDELAGALDQLVGDVDQVRRNGAIAHAQGFTWQACAAGHLEAYRAACVANL